MEQRHRGRIRWFSDRGYGFAEVDGEKFDVFYHVKSFRTRLAALPGAGDRISFAIETSEKGKSAVDIEMLTEESAYAH